MSVSLPRVSRRKPLRKSQEAIPGSKRLSMVKIKSKERNIHGISSMHPTLAL